MKFADIEIFHIRIPFKRSYKHSLAEHRASDTVLVKVTTDSGKVGWGETIPRQYLTGETPASVIDRIMNDMRPSVCGIEIKSFKRLHAVLEPVMEASQADGVTASYCGLELALLDAAGKEFHKDAGSILGAFIHNRINYTAPIDALSISQAMRRAFIFRLLGFRNFKVKVGQENDIELVRAVRKVIGSRADIRVDANCAWDAKTAIRKAQRLAGLGVTSIEQPTPADDIDSMVEVSRRSPIPVMADESLCTTRDAQNLARRKACSIFNIRLAKCGGLLGSREIVKVANLSGIDWQLGCLVGETSILAAAERSFLTGTEGFIHIEYPFTRQLLQVRVGSPAGPGIPCNCATCRRDKFGLGVKVDEMKVRRLISENCVGESGV